MNSPKIRSEFSVNTGSRGRQAASPENSAAGARILEALGENSRGWLARETGLPDSTIGDAIKRGPARTEVAAKIASALRVSLDWLVTGAGSTGATDRGHLADASSTDWVSVPSFYLLHLHDGHKGEPIASIPVRKDWLNAALGTANSLWIASMPCDYPPSGLVEGDKVFCRDVDLATLQERNLCIWRELETSRLFVGRFSAVRHDPLHVDENGEYWIGRGAVATADDSPPEVAPVGRIMGKPIAQIR